MTSSPRTLVAGASGFLGPFVAAALRAAGHTVMTVSRRTGDVAVDLTGAGIVAAVHQALAPDLVVNLAALSRLADCEVDPARARRHNVDLPVAFAERYGERLLHVSTDLVFDGRAAPYGPGAPPAPLSVYGATKAEGEQRVRAYGARVVRLPLLFGPDAAGRGASASIRSALERRQPVPLYTNEYRTPLHAADAAAALAALVLPSGAPTLVHIAGPERCSRWEFGLSLCERHGLDASWLRAVECPDPLRPRDVSLAGSFVAVRPLAAMLADA